MKTRVCKVWLKLYKGQKGSGTPYIISVPRDMDEREIELNLMRVAKLYDKCNKRELSTDTEFKDFEKQVMWEVITVGRKEGLEAIIEYMKRRYLWEFEELHEQKTIINLGLES